MKCWLLSLLLLCGINGIVTAQDTLWVRRSGGHAGILHKVKSGETLFILAKKYSVPPAALADLNQLNFSEGLAPGTKIMVPVEKYNFIRSENEVKSRALFYKATAADELLDISRMVGVSQSTIQRWNGMTDPEILPGMILQVGWIAFDKDQVPFAAKTETAPVISKPAKTAQAPKIPAPPPAKVPVQVTEHADTAAVEETVFSRLYEQQVAGVSLTEESGAAVFYPLRTQAAAGTYYAFHNTALKGSILKITNPASGKTIYAKVIGAIPTLKEYHNSIVGLSGNAAAALGAQERRMFCNIQYR